jgi:hypothetical protein
MDVLYPRAAGLDIHKRVVVACRWEPVPATWGQDPIAERLEATPPARHW